MEMKGGQTDGEEGEEEHLFLVFEFLCSSVFQISLERKISTAGPFWAEPLMDSSREDSNSICSCLC